MPPRLQIVSGPDAGRAIDLADDLMLGRDPGNHVQLRDPAASRHHVRVQKRDDFFVVRDLGSHNGTRVNGDLVHEHVLRPGDAIHIGRTILVYEDPAAAPPDAAPAATTALTVRTEKETTSALTGDRLQRLYRLLAALNEELDPEVTMRRLLEATLETLRADTAAILLEGWPEPQVASSRPGAAAIPRSILERAVRGGKALLLDPDEGAARSASVLQQKITSALCVPLIRRGRTLGALYVDRRHRDEPFDESDLDFLAALAHPAAIAFSNAITFARTEQRVRDLERQLGFGADAVGHAPRWLEALRTAEKAARADSPVLLLGESGTGKEVVARRVHGFSPRAKGPFVALNCAALVETLLESELFGHVKGAFTGAHRARTGRFDAADGGTLFLDEIGDMSPGVQAKLLRALQDHTFFRVGGVEPVTVDVRVIAATHRDLRRRIEEGSFREDLFYRIGVITIPLPPLRERVEDIPLLAYHFLERFSRSLNKPLTAIDNDALDALAKHPWPGNVRELQNVIERAVVMADGPKVMLDALPAEVRSPSSAPPKDFPVNMKEAEKWCITRALQITGGKKGESAKLLGISWPTLNRKIQEYGIETNV